LNSADVAANGGNRLIRAAKEALTPGSNAHGIIVNTIREDHIATARTLIRDREILGRVEREIEFECKRLEDFLNAAQVRRKRNILMERLSMK
jgi:aspartate kinase